MHTIQYTPIGTIHSPFEHCKGTPIQPVAARDVTGSIELYPDYNAALQDLDGFSHLILLYHFHCSHGYKLQVTPFLDTVPRGLFATRAPRRPNPIGLSVVRLDRIDGTTLYIRDVDIVDGTPLLDIKPYIPLFNPSDQVKVGWLTGKNNQEANKRADERFTDA